jgi:hypothetical protein
MAKKENKSLGAWAFLIGVIIALIIGLFSVSLGFLTSYIVAILFIIGIIVGILNVSGKESSTYLFAGTALVIVSYAGKGAIDYLANLSVIGTILNSVLGALLILFVPATIIVALKSLFALTKD